MPPGKEGKIELAVEHTEGYVGEVAKSANVTTNDPKMATFNLILRARFKADQPTGPNPIIPQPVTGKRVGPLLVEPTNRWITSALSGTASATSLYLINDQPNPIHIKQVIPGGNSFNALLTPIQDGRRYELRVASSTDLKPGHYLQTLRVVTDYDAAPELSIDLDVTVYPKVYASPQSIIMPPLPASSDLSSINWPLITIRKLRGDGLQLKKYSSTLPFLKLELLNDNDGQAYRIKLTLDQSKITKGEFKGSVLIETNDPDVPVIEIPIKGFFS